VILLLELPFYPSKDGKKEKVFDVLEWYATMANLLNKFQMSDGNA